MSIRKLLIASSVTVLILSTVLGVVFNSSQSLGADNTAQHSVPMPVQIATVRTGDLPIRIDELGTVTARKTVTVTPRVDGLIEQVLFREGQLVKKHQVLDELDPRPFQVVVDQWMGQLQHDQALLDDAKLDLVRYQSLLTKNSVAKQQVDTQLALVHQDEGTVLSDQAQLDNARLQLQFCHVTAPIAGRVGLRLVDEGNMVHAANATGLVVITQLQPIDVVFAVPSDQIAKVMPAWQASKFIPVEVYDRNDKIKLVTGSLLAIDNQINVTTGTANFKAAFANKDYRLFPNEFVNVHLQTGDELHTLLMPVAAIQTNDQGSYVYVVDKHNQVHMRSVVLGTVSDETAAVLKGLTAGEDVVVDGADRLREGSTVSMLGAHVGGMPTTHQVGEHHHTP